MDLLESLHVSDALHAISEGLLVPAAVLLVALLVCAVYVIGSVIVEAAVERRSYRARIPQLIARLDAAEPRELARVVDESGLLEDQREDIHEMLRYLYLPEDARTEVAKRLLANAESAYRKVVARTSTMAKVAPMLGLMCTLIPLGPGILALGSGDTETLSASLLTAFDGTVAGLASAVVCLAATSLRRRWYDDYLVSLEAVYNTLLEKARGLHDEGFDFACLGEGAR